MSLPTRDASRLAFWRALGIDALGAQQLVAFCQPLPEPVTTLPLPSEPQESFYQLLPSSGEKLFQELALAFPQLCFSPAPGLCQSQEWAAVVRRGEQPLPSSRAPLQAIEHLELRLLPTPAGTLPFLIAGCREDFVLLTQLLAHRGEPAPIPQSMGAVLIQGLVNWQRFRQLSETKACGLSGQGGEESWSQLAQEQWLYRDRLALAFRGVYSGVQAPPELKPAAWLDASLTIRLAHEATHYLTIRLFGKLGHTICEELVADWVGLGTAFGRYRPDLARQFMGVETPNRIRLGGRLANYRPIDLPDQAFASLAQAVFLAINSLAKLSWPGEGGLSRILPQLLSLSLEELAGGKLPPERGEPR